jgi:hypothetical protein
VWRRRRCRRSWATVLVPCGSIGVTLSPLPVILMSKLKPPFFLSMLLLLGVCPGCQSPLRSDLPPLSTATTITLEATPLKNGEFALTGTTNLPDDTQLTALALRYWVPAGADLGTATPRDLSAQAAAGGVATSQPLLYSVLDYQPVTVTNGQWSTQLNLWQVAADGRYQEPWQAQAESLKLTPIPHDTVQFAITLPPDRLGAALSHRADPASRPRVAEVLRVTADGEPFLWADQTRPVGLPRGQTTPPADRLARTNAGWGDRHLLVPEPPLPYTLTPADQRQTTAPLLAGEKLR